MLITGLVHFIASMVPSSLDLLIFDDEFTQNWKAFIAGHEALMAFAIIICFALPAAFCLLYALPVLRAADSETVKRRVTNAPTFLSAIGASGWVLNYMLELSVLAYAGTFIEIKASGILLSSAMILLLECLISFELSYFVLEALNRFWALRIFFPNGGVAKTKGVFHPSFSVLFAEFFVAVSVCPILFLLYALHANWKNFGSAPSTDFIICITLFMLSAVIVMLFFMKIISAPLNCLSEGMKRIKAGDLSVRIRIASNDKLGALGDSFNDMTASLQEKEFIQKTFGRFVDPAVRDHLLQGNTCLGGEICECTVLFCDIRNFTAMSEKLRPEEVVSFLNAYFTKMEQCITRNHGIINKYIGDAVMALFGAPAKSQNHAEDAFSAAIEMKDALAGLNAQRSAGHLPPVGFGIGLHSGDVLAGNIGSDTRLEYTVIGDTVNTASRIEALCKEYKTDLLLSEATAGRILAPALKQRIRVIGETAIRGKTDTVRLFSLAHG